ncbi:MAG TPA: hypothetical protein VGM17_07660, partial [Rhizomicrobium sp.]
MQPSPPPTRLEVRLVRAGRDFWSNARDHTIGFTVAFIAAILAVMLASWTMDMSHDIWILILQGFIGPVLLGMGYLTYCYIRAGDQIIDEKDAEISRLSRLAGEPVSQPSEPAILAGLGEHLRRNGGRIAVLLAGIGLAFFVYNSIQGKHQATLANKKLAVL